MLKQPEFSPLRRAQLAYSEGLLALSRDDAAGARAQFAESLALFDKVKAKFSLNVFALDGSRARGSDWAEVESARSSPPGYRTRVETLSNPARYPTSARPSRSPSARASRGETKAGQASLGEALKHLEQTLGEDHPATLKRRKLAAASVAALDGPTHGLAPVGF